MLLRFSNPTLNPGTDIWQGGKILTGGLDTKYARNFVQPTIAEISTSAKIVKGGWVFPVILVFKYQVISS